MREKNKVNHLEVGVVLKDYDETLSKLNRVEVVIDKINEKLEKANSLADELASETNPSPKNERPLEEQLANLLAGKNIVEAVFGIIIAIEESSDPETIARMINAYFNS